MFKFINKYTFVGYMKHMLLDFAMLIFSVSWRIIIYEDFVHVL